MNVAMQSRALWGTKRLWGPVGFLNIPYWGRERRKVPPTAENYSMFSFAPKPTCRSSWPATELTGNVISTVHRVSLWYYLYFSCYIKFNVGRDKSVGVATRYGLRGSGMESRWGARFSAPVHTDPGAHPASYTMGTWAFPGVKRLGHGVDHPPHLAPKLKEE